MTRFARLAAVLGLLSAAGCSPSPPTVIGTPVLLMNPSGRAPLAGLLMFRTDQRARATLTIRDDENNAVTATPNDGFDTLHELMVLGLRPGRNNTIEVSLETERGLAVPGPSIDVETKPLPGSVPPIDVRVSRPPRMEPGVTFLPVFDSDVENVGFIVALDAQGDVIWYYDVAVDEPRRMENGHFLMMDDFRERRRLVEVDMLGRTVRRWHATGITNDPPDGAIPVATDTFHHDVIILPSGNFMALSTELRHVEDYPTSDTDPSAPREPRDIAADRIIEFVPETGEIVRSWSLYDLIDPNRIAQSFDATHFYDGAYDNILDEPPVDWSHTNSLVYDEPTDTLILSIRKMSAIVKIDLAASELVWILGDPTGWGPEFQDLLLEPVGIVDWPYGQHAPEILPSGNLLVYDNGSWGRAYPPNEGAPIEERYSQAVEYAIDEENMTVRQIWSYGGFGTDHFYSAFAGEADRLPQTGNILLTNGGQEVDDAGRPFYAGYESDVWPRVKLSMIEVTHETPAEKLWEISIDTVDGGWGAYRAERLPSLYP
ncbi:MAG TPA: aryl-sulfate sulfotransferase [Gammaproteobacteria bacterium]|nr:aryl-sulfate sulfotransferase [Gammaproteobacteria bacterium]